MPGTLENGFHLTSGIFSLLASLGQLEQVGYCLFLRSTGCIYLGGLARALPNVGRRHVTRFGEQDSNDMSTSRKKGL